MYIETKAPRVLDTIHFRTIQGQYLKGRFIRFLQSERLWINKMMDIEVYRKEAGEFTKQAFTISYWTNKNGKEVFEGKVVRGKYSTRQLTKYDSL